MLVESAKSRTLIQNSMRRAAQDGTLVMEAHRRLGSNHHDDRRESVCPKNEDGPAEAPLLPPPPGSGIMPGPGLA